MNFIEYLKPRLRAILGLSLLVSLLSYMVFPALPTLADSARFNYLENDYELLRGRNETANATVWKDPVDATVGDTISGIVYYHNGTQDTTAANTKIKVNIPATTTGNNAFVEASISADGIDPIYDTIIKDVPNGPNGLTINLNQPASLALVPGSVRWLPEASTKGMDTATALPNDQTGDEIISANGINIGGIDGCWQYAGYVIFQIKTSAIAAPPSLTINKTVRDLTKAEPLFGKDTHADYNDTVEFDVAITNNGTVPVDNINVSDVMPIELTYQDGTLKKIHGSDNTAADSSRFFSTSGLDESGALIAGDVVHFRYQTKATAVVGDETSAVNTAKVMSGNINLTSAANVILVPSATNIERTKAVTNNTTGAAAAAGTVDGKSVLTVNANAGDLLTYTLTTKNNGQLPAKVTIKDETVSDVLNQADFVSATDNGSLDNTGNPVKVVFPAITLAVGQSVDRSFTVKVKPLSNVPAQGTNNDDRLENTYGNKVVVVILRPVAKVNLSFSKSVRDFTTNESDFSKSNEAYAGDTLEYKIIFANSGDAPADNVKIYDTLPSNTQYIAGTTIISRSGGADHTMIDGITQSSGITLNSIGAGENGYIKFKVLTATTLANGELLQNTANLIHKDTSLTDSAKTKIKVVVTPAPTATTSTPITKSLPQTGVATSAAFLITLFMGVMMVYLRYRKDIETKFEVLKVAYQLIEY